MMRRTARGLAAAALVVAATLSAAPPLSAQLLNDPFGSESVGISEQDWTLMKNAMAAVLAQYKVGATSDWKSPTGRRAGRWTMTRTYQRDGMKCAQITHKFTVGSGYTYTAPICQVQDGSWKLAF
jgi:surface antigen